MSFFQNSFVQDQAKNIITDLGNKLGFGPTQEFMDRDERKKQIENIVIYWRKINDSEILGNKYNSELAKELGKLKEWWQGGEEHHLTNAKRFDTKWKMTLNELNNNKTSDVLNGVDSLSQTTANLIPENIQKYLPYVGIALGVLFMILTFKKG